MRLIPLTLVPTLACLWLGCAPYTGTCAWLDLTGNASVRVVAPRKVTAPQECDCSRCAAPGQFEIRRDKYKLEFWNGDRWYPAFLARARSAVGRPLALKSDELKSIPLSSAQGKWKEFDYYVDVVNGAGTRERYRFPTRLSITILDEQGTVLGTEQIVPRLEIRRHIAFDSL